MLTIHNGRPAVLDGRSDREKRVYELLDSLSLEYLTADHEKADTMDVCEKIDEAFGIKGLICKNLFLCNRQKTKYYLLMMPADKKFLTKDLSAQINSARLSFAGEEDMLSYLDITPGSVSVLGLMNDSGKVVQLLIDSDLLKSEYVGCHPCINTSTVKLKVKDLQEKILPKVSHEAVYVNL